MRTKKLAEEIFETIKKDKLMMFNEQTTQFIKGEKALLAYLFFEKEAITSGALSDKLGVSTARVAFALNNLEKKQFISRTPDKVDKRKVWVSITEDGCREIKRHQEHMVDTLCKIIDEIGEDKIREHLALIAQIKKIIERETNKKEKKC